MAALGDYKKSNLILNNLVRYQDSLSSKNKASLTRLYERNMATRKANESFPGNENETLSNGSNSWLVIILIGICLAMLLSVLV